jgi:hypothetical protein
MIDKILSFTAFIILWVILFIGLVIVPREKRKDVPRTKQPKDKVPKQQKPSEKPTKKDTSHADKERKEENKRQEKEDKARRKREKELAKKQMQEREAWSVRPVKRSDARRLRGKPAKRKNANGIVSVRRNVSANVADGQRKTVGSANTRRCSMTSTAASKVSAHSTHGCTSRS